MPKRGLAKEFRHRLETSGHQQIADKTIGTVTLAEWLRSQATFVESQGGNLAGKYTARYCAR